MRRAASWALVLAVLALYPLILLVIRLEDARERDLNQRRRQ